MIVVNRRAQGKIDAREQGREGFPWGRRVVIEECDGEDDLEVGDDDHRDQDDGQGDEDWTGGSGETIGPSLDSREASEDPVSELANQGHRPDQLGGSMD